MFRLSAESVHLDLTEYTAQERASKIMRETVSMLRSDGLTVRDVAAVTCVSPQRVSALQDA